MTEQRYESSEEFRANVRAATRQRAIDIFRGMALDYFGVDEAQLVIRIFGAGVDETEVRTIDGNTVTVVVTYDVEFGAVMRIPVP